ncbi:hypothetical protein [Streptomyces zhihengii]|uniref:hypothetical protein n=1 Tax=Streptomyces zhihengii TaxID=1818004 RepID=UPI003F512399
MCHDRGNDPPSPGGIPLYLLVDRDASSVTLLSAPGTATTGSCAPLPFGKPLPLPEPFGFDLETSDLV